MATPSFNIGDFLAAQQPASGATTAPTRPQGKAYKAGKAVGTATRIGAKILPAAAAGLTLAEGALGEATIPNAIRTGVGLGALVNPAVGLPLAAGMQVGGLATEFIGNRLIDRTLAATDIRGPETKRFQAQGARVAGFDEATMNADNPPQAPAVVPAPVPQAPVAGPGNLIVPERGTGFIQNQQTGRTVQIGSPTPPGPGTAPREFRPTGNPAGDFMGALIGLKQISGDNAQRLAQQKAKAAQLAAQGTAATGAAALDKAARLDTLTTDFLRQNPGSFERASGVLSGRPVAAPRKSIPQGGVFGTKATDPVLVFDPATGTTEVNYPTQSTTMAAARESAKRHTGKTPSDAAIRLDMAAKNITLTD